MTAGGRGLEAADGDGLRVDGDQGRRGSCGLGDQQRLLPRLDVRRAARDTGKLRQRLGDLNI